MNLIDIVQDAEVSSAFQNTDFGKDPNFRFLIKDALLKHVCNYEPGSTIKFALQELGLLTKYVGSNKWQITKKGKIYLYEAFSNEMTIIT